MPRPAFALAAAVLVIARTASAPICFPLIAPSPKSSIITLTRASKGGRHARSGGRRCNADPPADARPGRADSDRGRVARLCRYRTIATSSLAWLIA